MTNEEQKESEPITPLNIVLLPDEETSRLAIEMSNNITGEVETYFTLDPKKRRPHITLYQSPFPNRNISKLADVVKAIAEKTEPVKMSLHKVTVEFGTFAFWTADNSPELANLHKAIVTQTNPLREGHIPAHLASVPLEPADAEDVKNYGLPMVLERYWPHLTLTRIKNPKDAGKAMEILGAERFATFQAKGISICNLGNHGTVNNTVIEFLLSPR